MKLHFTINENNVGTKEIASEEFASMLVDIQNCVADIANLGGDMTQCEIVLDNISTTLNALETATKKHDVVSVCNIDNSLTALTSMQNPSPAAVTEGLGSALSSAWDKFCELCRRFWGKIKEICSKIIEFFTGKQQTVATKTAAVKEHASKSEELIRNLAKDLAINNKELDSMLADADATVTTLRQHFMLCSIACQHHEPIKDEWLKSLQFVNPSIQKFVPDGGAFDCPTKDTIKHNLDVAQRMIKFIDTSTKEGLNGFKTIINQIQKQDDNVDDSYIKVVADSCDKILNENVRTSIKACDEIVAQWDTTTVKARLITDKSVGFVTPAEAVGWIERFNDAYKQAEEAVSDLSRGADSLLDIFIHMNGGENATSTKMACLRCVQHNQAAFVRAIMKGIRSLTRFYSIAPKVLTMAKAQIDYEVLIMKTAMAGINKLSSSNDDEEKNK